MKNIIWTATLLIVLGLSSKTYAQTTPAVAQKQINQQARIQEGKRSGDLTRREKRHLQMQQAKIQKDKRMAKADGTVTCQERRQLKKNNEGRAEIFTVRNTMAKQNSHRHHICQGQVATCPFFVLMT